MLAKRRVISEKNVTLALVFLEVKNEVRKWQKSGVKNHMSRGNFFSKGYFNGVNVKGLDGVISTRIKFVKW